MTDLYKEFMCNPENEHNCAQCPENQGFDSWPGTRLPCGQFNCWVYLNCKNDEDNSADYYNEEDNNQ